MAKTVGMVEYTFQPNPVTRVTGFAIISPSACAQMSVRPDEASLIPMDPIPNTRSAIDAVARGSTMPMTTAPMTARIRPENAQVVILPGGMAFRNMKTAIG